MADISQYIPFLRRWEGGFVNHAADRGGPTNQGVTLRTWQQVGVDKDGNGIINTDDLLRMSTHDLVERVLRPHFWNRWQADRIRTQAIAEVLVDWMWMCGPYSIRLAQKELKVKMDGIVGNKTLSAINTYGNQRELFYRLKVARYAHLYRICDYRPANRIFLAGWINRVRALKFTLSVVLLMVLTSIAACRSTAPKLTTQHQVREMAAQADSTSHRESVVTTHDRVEESTDEWQVVWMGRPAQVTRLDKQAPAGWMDSLVPMASIDSQVPEVRIDNLVPIVCMDSLVPVVRMERRIQRRVVSRAAEAASTDARSTGATVRLDDSVTINRPLTGASPDPTNRSRPQRILRWILVVALLLIVSIVGWKRLHRS